jgi:hypothetical protein
LKKILIALVIALMLMGAFGSIAIAGDLNLPNGKTIEVPADESDNAGKSGVVEQDNCSGTCTLDPCPAGGTCVPPCVPPCEDGGI